MKILPKGRVRTRRRPRSAKPLVLILIGAIMVVAGGLTVRQQFAPQLLADVSSDSEHTDFSPLTEEIAKNGQIPERLVYPHSIVPGGVASAEEVRAATDRDPVVADHYRGFDENRARLVTLDAPQQAYVSYRIKNAVYWTKKKISLFKGERVITDGKTTIRARCGNRVSDAPQAPVSLLEPPEETLNSPELPQVVAFSPPPEAPLESAVPTEPPVPVDAPPEFGPPPEQSRGGYIIPPPPGGGGVIPPPPGTVPPPGDITPPGPPPPGPPPGPPSEPPGPPSNPPTQPPTTPPTTPPGPPPTNPPPSDPPPTTPPSGPPSGPPGPPVSPPPGPPGPPEGPPTNPPGPPPVTPPNGPPSGPSGPPPANPPVIPPPTPPPVTPPPGPPVLPPPGPPIGPPSEPPSIYPPPPPGTDIPEPPSTPPPGVPEPPPVPEPSTYVLMGAGLVTLAFMRSRRPKS